MPCDWVGLTRLSVRMGVVLAVWRGVLAGGAFDVLSGFIPFSVLIWGVPAGVAIGFFSVFCWRRGCFFSLLEGVVAVSGSALLALSIQYLTSGLLSLEGSLPALALIGAVDVAVLTVCLGVSWHLVGKRVMTRRGRFFNLFFSIGYLYAFCG